MEQVFDASIASDTQSALDFITSILQASTEYSIVGVDLSGKIRLWNAGAQRIFGYAPGEMIGQSNLKLLFTPEDVKSGVIERIIDEALGKGKWEGNLTRVRKSGEYFTAHTVINPFYNSYGRTLGVLIITKDITQELRLIDQLKSVQFYMRSLIESNIDAMIATDPLGIITDVNQMMEALVGRKREELIGTLFKNYFSDPIRAENGIRKVLQEDKVKNYELIALSKDGRETIVSFNASTFKNEQDELMGIFAAARDITEQKKLENKLRTSELYNRSLIEASVDAMFAISPTGIITDVNEEATRLTGYKREQLIDSKFSDYFTDSLKTKAGVDKTLHDKRVRNYEIVLKKKNQEEVEVNFSAGVYTDSAGLSVGILAVARDIQLQKELQKKLQDAQFYTRSLIESNIDALVTTDPLGIITDVNEEMVKISGYSRDKLIGTPFKQYFTDPERAENGIRKVLQKKQVIDYELTIKAKGDEEIDVSCNGTVFYDKANKLQGVFASARDITERKKIEADLNDAMRQLKDSNRELKEFMNIATHDLQEPLRMIASFTQLLAKKYKGNLDKEADEFIDFIMGGTTRLQHLMNDLSMYMRVAECEVILTVVDANEVLKKALKQLDDSIKRTQAEITYDSLPQVKACAKHFQKLFENLIDNGIKFNKQKPIIHIGVKSQDDHWVFSIKDNGIGIDPSYQSRIFTIFQRLNARDTYPGYGIGLPICLKIIQHHHGRIWVESVKDQGSTFYFTIPKMNALDDVVEVEDSAKPTNRK